MKQLVTSLALILSLVLAPDAFAVAGKPGVPLPKNVEAMLNLGTTPPPIVKLGSQVTQKKVNVMKAVYDPLVLGGISGTYVLRDAAGGQAVLPKAAVIKQVIIDTVTAVTGTSSPTIALGINSTNDLKTATAIGSYTGVVAGIPVGTAATSVKVTSSDKAVTATTTGGVIQAGKLNVFLEYYLSD